MSGRLFGTVLIVGAGLIGSSLARALRREGLAGRIVAADASARVRVKLARLGIVDEVVANPASEAGKADLVVIATPLSAYAALGRALGPALKRGAILTDVGSVKRPALVELGAHVARGAHLVPGHPVAGTENSGPEAGFADLFPGRWCILTPAPRTARPAVERVAEMWRRIGMRVATMDAEHHDRVLAITSHVPHLIAYTIVNTASDLEGHIKAEIIKFAAGGFRDFTRVAASDPIMWRDVFLNNRDAVLEMLGRLYEDIALLQKAIRNGDGDTLERVFTRARAIRRSVVQAKQD